MPQSTICRNFLVSILLGSVLTISTCSAAETPRVPDVSTVIRALKKDAVKRDKAATISDLMLLRTHATEYAAGPSFSANTHNKIGEILEGVGRNRQKEISDLLLSEAIWYFDSAANLASSNNAVDDEKTFLDNEIHAYERLHNISSDSREFSGPQFDLIGLIPLIQRILSVSTKLYGRDSIWVGAISLNLAYLYLDTSQPNDAKIYFQKTIDILRPALSDKLHVSQESLIKGGLREMIPEAFVAYEQAMLQTLDFAGGLSVLGQYLEFAHSVNDVHEIAESLNRIGMHFYYTNDYTTAISYYKKALQASERGGESETDHTVIIRNNLATAYFGNKQVDEAIVENRIQYKRLTYLNKDGGYSDHINICQNNYAAMLGSKNVYAKAVAIFEDVIRNKQGKKKRFCEDCADEYFNVASTLLDWNRTSPDSDILSRAENYILLSTRANIQNEGARSPPAADDLILRGRIAARRKDFLMAYKLAQQALSVYEELFNKLHVDRQRYIVAAREAAVLELLAIDGGAPIPAQDRLDVSFKAGQLLAWSSSAEAVGLVSDRFLEGRPELQPLIRQRQQMALDREREANLLSQITLNESSPSQKATRLRSVATISRLDGELQVLDKSLASKSPLYSVSRAPKLLSVNEALARLRDDEALVVITPAKDATYAWIITKNDQAFFSSALGEAKLSETVQRLRCGLDIQEWATIDGQVRCGRLTSASVMPDPQHPLPFNLEASHQLYTQLVGMKEDTIKGKSLFVLTAGSLSSLPLQVLVTKQPSAEPGGTYASTAWFGAEYPITVIPAVSSLPRIEVVQDEARDHFYLGMGDPTLGGNPSCRPSDLVGSCGRTPGATQLLNVSMGSRSLDLKRTGTSYVNGDQASTELGALVRRLCPLPETAYELRCIAGALPNGEKSDLKLGEDFTLEEIERLDASHMLANYRVIHFATHALLPVSQGVRLGMEPALVLTPSGTGGREAKAGLLTASQIATLHLNSDLVILSACSTAAGDALGGEALSGLARSFFFAGAKSLLVSHWPVYSDAAAELMIKMFGAIDSKHARNRADALRLAMSSLISDQSSPNLSHPSVWAPFSLVAQARD